MILSDGPSKLQIFRDRLKAIVPVWDAFCNLKCKMLLQNRSGSKLNHILTEGGLGEADRFNYLGDCVSLGGRMSDVMKVEGLISIHPFEASMMST